MADQPRRGAVGRVAAFLSPGTGPGFRELSAEAGWYPLVIITTLNVVDELDRAVLAVFGPNLKRYFGMDNATLGALVGLQVLAILVLAVPVGYWSSRMDRARMLRWSAVIWSAFSFATSFAVRLPVFFVARIGTGIGKAAVEPVGRSLLTDYYPPTGWNRVLAVHSAANPLGGLLGPAMAGALALFVDGDGIWRWAFPLLTIPSVLALLAARRLHEPESQMVKTMTGAMLTVTGAPKDMGFWPSVRRLLEIRTFRRQLVGIAVLGFGLVGLLTFFNVFLEDEFGLDEAQRGLVGMLTASAALLGNLIGGNVGERIFEQSPRRAVQMVGVSIAAFSVVFGVGVFIPLLPVFLMMAWFGVLALSIGTAPLFAAMSAITPPQLRALMFALLGVVIALFGGVTGGVLVGLIADASSTQLGLATLAPMGIIGGLLMSRGAATIEDDIARVAAELAGEAPAPTTAG